LRAGSALRADSQLQRNPPILDSLDSVRLLDALAVSSVPSATAPGAGRSSCSLQMGNLGGSAVLCRVPLDNTQYSRFLFHHLDVSPRTICGHSAAVGTSYSRPEDSIPQGKTDGGPTGFGRGVPVLRNTNADRRPVFLSKLRGGQILGADLVFTASSASIGAQTESAMGYQPAALGALADS